MNETTNIEDLSVMIKKVFKVSVVVCFCVGLVPMTAEGGRVLPPSIEAVNGLEWTPTPAPRKGAFAARYNDPKTEIQWDLGARHKDSTNSDTPKELKEYPLLSVTNIRFPLIIGPDESKKLNVNYVTSNGWTVYASAQGPANTTIDSSQEFFVIPDEAPEDPFGAVLEGPVDPMAESVLEKKED